MGWFAQCKKLWQRVRSPWRQAPELTSLLAEADSSAPVEERIVWLCHLLDWIRQPSESGETQAASHIGLLLQTLEQQPERRMAVAKTFRSVLRDTSALDLFCETGLPREHGFLRELGIRLSEQFLPDRPYSGELGMLFDRLFPHAEDPHWISSLDEAMWCQLQALLLAESASDEPEWNTLKTDIEGALGQLAASIRITGTSLEIRIRIGRRQFRELPFFKLTAATESLLAAYRAGDSAEITAELNLLRLQLDNCGKAIDSAYSHLEEYGVSTDIVYQLARIDKQLQRMETLLELLLTPNTSAGRLPAFIAQLIREHQEHRGVRSLLRGNLQLLTRKMVERNADTGEHYIARDRKQYHELIRHAAGGGAIMGFTTWLKFGLGALHLPLLIEGVVFGFNYACSFVAIQVCSFTLATKQPATTAPALAARMNSVRDPVALQKLVDEIVCLIRSQMGAIIGNLALTFPLALFIAWLGDYLLSEPLLGVEKAEKTIHALSAFGFTPIYAAFTGVLLWLTSLAGGFADNWFAYHRLRAGITNSPRLQFILSVPGAARVAKYLDDNIAGLTSNILLGFLLGLVPAFGLMTGLPIDVRHVTLGTGQFAASIFTMGAGVVYTSDFWLAFMGIMLVGVINVGVSFGLAMWVAIRARQVSTPERRAIYVALLERLNERPLSFLWPEKDAAVPAAQSHVN